MVAASFLNHPPQPVETAGICPIRLTRAEVARLSMADILPIENFYKKSCNIYKLLGGMPDAGKIQKAFMTKSPRKNLVKLTNVNVNDDFFWKIYCKKREIVV